MKKIISVILSACIFAGLCANTYAVDYGEELKNAPQMTYEQTFSDVPKSFWAFEYIAEMVNRGVLNGYPDGKFYPNSQVTRAEFAKIMTMAAGLSLAEPTMQIFNDVKTNDWHAPYVHTAKEYLSAYVRSDGQYYMPNSPALREDIAVALVKLKGYSIVGADMTTVTRMFSDYHSISEDAKIYVAAAVENGLISGYDDGTFKGQNGITRAEAATLLWRAYQYGNANKVYDATEDNNKKVVKIENEVTDKTTQNNTKNEQEKTEVAEPELKKKAYVMKRLASANSISHTFDDNDTIYYLEKDDNCVYEISISGGSKSKFFDVDDLSYQVIEEKEVENVEEVTETVTKTVETGEFEEIEEEITETVIDEETGEETEVTKTVKKQVPITEEVTEEITKEIVTTETEEIVVEEYTDFVPTQVYYDNVNDRLLLLGYYTSLSKAFSTPTECEEMFLYDISNKVDTVLAKLEDCLVWYSYESRYYYGKESRINGILDSDRIIITMYEYYDDPSGLIDLNRQKASEIKLDFRSYESGLKYGSNFYILAQNYYQTCIGKYSFSDDEIIYVSDDLDYKSFAIKDDSYYFLNGNNISKISVRNGKTTNLDINTKSENVEFEDMGNMNGISEKFFVVDDNTMVFYDNEMESFRILEKNK